MKNGNVLLAAALWATLAGGCQCIGLTEHYSDVIDDVADHQPMFDWIYHPCFDLTRIGQPDWCSCWFNRLWCHGTCERDRYADCRPFYCPFCAEDHPPYIPPQQTPPPQHQPPPQQPPQGEGAPEAPSAPGAAVSGWSPRRQFFEPVVIPSQ